MLIYYSSRRPDLDESLILDLMQGVIYKNDRQVKQKNIYWGLIGKGQEQSSECHLWRAVISQAISDAYLNEPKEREIIEMWIHTEDFITVCDLADIDYDKMKNNFIHILESKPAVARYEGRKLKDLIDRK